MKLLASTVWLFIASSTALAFIRPVTDEQKLPEQYAEVVVTVEGMT